MGRPRTPLLDRERITTAALELVDAQGEFSVPQIARRLGVQTGSLYHHVDGRDGIVELLRERVTEAIDATTLDLRPWDTAMAAWARSYRAAFAAHPRAIPLLMTNPVRAPRVLEHYERAVTLLLDAGFRTADVMPVIIALENMVLGSALDLAAPEAMWEIADASATPRLAEALAALGDSRTDRSFDLALEGFLAHARRTLEARGGASG
ncbi:TetR/AcrR family transcriptional regulator [Streptomyces chartreusis]|jgi:AcrR family transcriptional regulator|uniref:TetR/AcrR family transcriptional regulator n=1 Tax=Streptomyces chartreusis TaxID=1969 RepID=UPI002F919CE9|nr:TetR/AcrR family transcriptional regulator C-terminal domain-containing protein [Streptomyces chartreusis]WTA32886.1 TetR/AcrR family transcriptional regulator C-terminal domain-containing protein [Streptomyces chartreusis]